MNETLSTPIWAGGTPLRCIARREETSDTATFFLAADTPQRFEYRPGQFMLVGVDIGGKKIQRAYSLSSSPSQPQHAAITVKRVNGGVVSNWLLDNFKEGAYIEAGKPAGEFYLAQDALPQDVVLLSAGSGITPMMSMSRWLLDAKQAVQIHFIHSARNQDDVIFRDELLALAATYDNFKLKLVLSRSGEPGSGRLTAERLASLLPPLSQAQVYLCGQQEYMDQVEAWLRSLELPPARLFKESFTPPAAQEVDPAAVRYKLAVPAFNKSMSIAVGQSLLDVMEAEGLPIIGACRSGMCGSCKCKVTAGDVVSTSMEVLTPAEIDAGYVLACSTTVGGDVTVELG